MRGERNLGGVRTFPRGSVSIAAANIAGAASLCVLAALAVPRSALAQEAASTPAAEPEQTIDIFEYRVEGAHVLPQAEVEQAVYPFLGPGRVLDDVEQARAALEKAYAQKGYQTVAVEIPQQRVRDGVVVLKVTEGAVGRLRVRGSRYYSLDQIREEAPSLAEGSVPNFNDVTRDIINLNQQPDRRVTPALRAGVAPGTVDVDLNVEDTFPLHGTFEVNNRYSEETSKLRLNASLRYDNLWQLGHSVSFSYQVAPENRDDAEVYSGSYLAGFSDIPWLNVLAYGVKNNSDVATLGGTNVVGRGEVIGLRAIATLPSKMDGFFHQLNVGLDYKNFEEVISLGGDELSSPITYYPISVAYSATAVEEGAQTQAEISLTFGLRNLGSSAADYDQKRYRSGGDFMYLRADFSHSQDIGDYGQIYGHLQGQLSSRPLVSSEQFSAGGQDTVRGYLESAALGDNGLIASLELRSPSLTSVGGGDWSDGLVNEWRVYTFADTAVLHLLDPLPEQESKFELASVGLGSRIRLFDYLNGSVDLGIALREVGKTDDGSPHVHFRVWGEF
jgi:hemolysin activation/secretion protein